MNTQWGLEWGHDSIQSTLDGGYIFVGTTNSQDGDVSGTHGDYDLWIGKCRSDNSPEWIRSYGGSLNDGGESIQSTGTGYYVLGNTLSDDGDVSGNHGGADLWVLKLDLSGHIIWQKCLGGTSDETGRDVALLPDGGILVLGFSYSSDGDVPMNRGYADYWVTP